MASGADQISRPISLDASPRISRYPIRQPDRPRLWRYARRYSCLNGLNTQMMQSEDKQISLTDPDARSMATSGRGSGMVGYNVQSAVDTKHHLIVAHEMTNVGSDRSQLSCMSERARAVIGSEVIEAVADRGYYSGEEILSCEQAGITVYLPKPITSGVNVKGRFGKQDFVYATADDVYICPAGAKLTYHCTNEEDGKTLRRYWTTACQGCALKIAQQAKSGGSHAGSTKPSLRPCRHG